MDASRRGHSLLLTSERVGDVSSWCALRLTSSIPSARARGFAPSRARRCGDERDVDADDDVLWDEDADDAPKREAKSKKARRELADEMRRTEYGQKSSEKWWEGKKNATPC